MLGNVLLTAVGLALIGIARLAFNAVALHAFGERLAGSLNVALSLAVLLSLPASTAFGATTVRYMAQARGQGRPGLVAWLYRTLLLATGALAVVVTAAALAGRRQLAASQGIDTALVLQAVLLSVTYAVYLFFRNVLYALDRVRAYAVVEVVSHGVFFAFLTFLAVAGAGRALLASFLLGQAAFIAVTAHLTRRVLLTPAAPAERVAWRELGTYSTVAFVGTAASLSVRELAVFFAPTAADLGGAAHLALSMSVLAPLQFLPRMLRTALFAHSAELDGRGRRQELGRSLGTASHYLVLVTLPLCALLALTAAPLLGLLGGTPTPERLLVFRLLALASLVDVVATPAANALPGIGDVKTPSYAAVAALAATGVVWLALAPTWGLSALALGLVVNSAIKAGGPIWLVRRALGAPLTRSPIVAIVLFALALAGLGLLSIWDRPLPVAGLYLAVALPVLWSPGRALWHELGPRLRRLRPAPERS